MVSLQVQSATNQGQRYSVVSFDLDRTLIFHAKNAKQQQVVDMLALLGCSTTVAAYRAATHVAREFYDVLGYKFANDPAALRRKYVQTVLEMLGCSEPDVIDEVAAFYHSYDQEVANFTVPTEAVNLLDALLQRGCALAAISSNLFAPQRLQHCGLDGYFAHVLTPASGFPKAELFRLLLVQTGVNSVNILHVGDDPILDVLAPQSFGIDAILFDPDGTYATLSWPMIAHDYAAVNKYISESADSDKPV